MATTTPNYGWTVPTSTDLVKDGATAIETLGDAIDASMNTALGTKKAGMVLLNTTSFSGVASQSFNDVFSTTYDYYKLVIYGKGSADADFKIRFRVAGSDNSTSNYGYQVLEARGNSIAGGKSTSQTSWTIGTLRNGQDAGLETIIYRPFNASRKFFFTNTFDPDPGGGGFIMKLHTGLFDADTSFTGFTAFPSSGNMTGSLSVFGFSK